jgi:hypothetical protein
MLRQRVDGNERLNALSKIPVHDKFRLMQSSPFLDETHGAARKMAFEHRRATQGATAFTEIGDLQELSSAADRARTDALRIKRWRLQDLCRIYRALSAAG